MDLKLAYNKIDNLCCLNDTVMSIIKSCIEQNLKIDPKEIDFFKAYKETNGDEDFCKDTNEMVDALETIKKVVDLQDDFGGSLVMILNLMKNSNTLDEHYHTQDIYFDYKGKLIRGSFIRLEYNKEFIINVQTDEMFDSRYDIDDYDLKVKDYRKTWWLREDKSE